MMSWICALPLVATLLCGPAAPLAVGYVEGEYVLLAPYDVAQVVAVEVRKGDRLEQGAIVARLETEDGEIAVAEAEAAFRQAVAQLDNLKLGKRAEEIAVIEATLNSAIAQLKEAERAFERQKELAGQGFASKARYDAAETALASARARVAELEANLAVARLPARPAEIVAAENAVKRTRASLETARWRLDKRTVRAPAAGEVADVVRRSGELAGPSAPVISFLPDGAVKLKVYVAEPDLASVEVGARLAVRCDGCGEEATATVSFVAREPEFTPPVIYSINNRQKLVYLVEARPDDGARRLKPGQIVDVLLAPPEHSAGADQ